jgi:carbohydrate-selective porin OprB
MRNILAIICLTIFSIGIAQAKTSAVSWTGFAAAEDIDNIHGGIKSGSVLLATGEITATVDLQKAGWWDGGKVALGVFGLQQTHNQSLYTGSIQGPSNLTGVNEIKLSDLAYEQDFSNHFMARAGIMDIENYFNRTEVSDYICNSAHHTGAWIANVQVPTTPFPGFGALGQYQDQTITAQVAIFQGNPQHQGSVFNRGYLLIGELAGTFTGNNKWSPNVTLKAGVWQYHQTLEWVGHSNHGLYGIVEAIWETQSGRTFDVALDLGTTPKKYGYVYDSFAIYFSMSKLLDFRPKDHLNAAVGSVWITNFDTETFVELSYSIHIIDNLRLIPDVQYFVKPSGIYPNAWVGILRLMYEF